MHGIDTRGLETPVTVIDLGALESNLRLLADVQDRSGCRILLALKGFAMWSTFPLVGRYLRGVTSSSPHEARLGKEKMGKEVHAYAPAYDDRSLTEILELADHVVFNSFTQLRRFRAQVLAKGGIEIGIRVNPEHSEVKVPLYDPCAPGSRLGVPFDQFDGEDLDGVSGLHFHTLCELGVEPLARTLAVVEQKFGRYFPRLKWLNFGGGHHITKPEYARDSLVELVRDFRARTGLDVYLEPGEAIAIGTGVLASSVLDIVKNAGIQIAILDTSATAHMPDVLEMPYRPEIVGAQGPGVLAHTYRLGGLTCLAGDVIGDYSFAKPLEVGDQVVFLDMAHYTTVKTTTFNGVKLPSLATWDPVTRTARVVRRFGYEDFAGRLS
ncbi:MAG: carboxynorspermidine decarboxylase [Deltaproteobacteria bacterium]|nr:carboxynorspermidine decarboxylase [Deltaproteobacteria bacterium]